MISHDSNDTPLKVGEELDVHDIKEVQTTAESMPQILLSLRLIDGKTIVAIVNNHVLHKTGEFFKDGVTQDYHWRLCSESDLV